MLPSPEQFAQLLTEGIKRVHVREGKTIQVIQDELGYLLERQGGTAIEHWRKGRLPPRLSDVEKLARALVKRGMLDQTWLEAFLRSAGHPAIATLAAEIFSPMAVPTASRSAREPLEDARSAGNFIADLKPLVGRHQEMAHLAKMMADPQCRLITISGAGGIGKTRLAFEIAAKHTDLFEDGVLVVPLVALTSPESIIPTISTALRLAPGGEHEAAVSLFTYLGERRMLLILDNFDHLVEGSSCLVDLLRQAPGVKLLVTSRERLNMQAEWTFDLGGLEVPPAETTQSEKFEEYSAVALFVQRARQVEPAFQVDSTEQAVITHICRMLQGMPLALELAASWLRVLSCTELAQEIDRNLSFLETRSRDVPSRHRSLQAVFENSWQLLTVDEQNLFARLSVFRASFTRNAAIGVAGASLPLLASLVDKSLLRRMAIDRYEMHEFARQFARVKLQAMGELEATRDRHIVYLVEQTKRELEQVATKHFHPDYILARRQQPSEE